MEKILQGNYAIARGAWEAGVKVACAYPGTPSSEVLLAIASLYKNDIQAEWSPNEKVALEVSIGASFAGARALVCMKHVGLNVASDPFMTLSYTGVKGGLVILVADDPYAHSSQNEQDSRHWARFGKAPMIEPSDSQECKDFVKLAFDLSEQFDTPVLLRTETRISHSFSPVILEDRKESLIPIGLDMKDAPKYTMVPIYVRQRRLVVEERMKKLEAFADDFKHNIMEINDSKIGVITSGVSYQYTKEVFPNYSYFKLGMVWPLPRKMIAEFFQKVKKVIIVEELDPFFETEIKAMGYKIFHGKDVLPSLYEFNPEIIEQSIKGKRYKPPVERINAEELPKRPPNLCSACSHRPLFYALKKLGVFVFGDIGCYTLAAGPPLNAIHTTVCMGAGVGAAFGATKVLEGRGLGKVCSVIGDSTFLHGGITPLMNIVYNKGSATTIILDNRTTGMTGLQEHAGTGYTIGGESTHQINLEVLVRALGVKHVRKVDPYHIKETMEVIKEELERDEPSVIITMNGPCMLHRREKRQFEHPYYAVEMEKCRGCGMCLEIGCPAITWKEVSGDEILTEDGHKRKGVVSINRLQCPGCGVCRQICKFESIVPGKA
ncbi:MAG: indolepyruvate ferredoxin oxidoreductase subunit alpha [Deltaproteobacteria bacterium RBG_16_49_23]|nr:MAG: indolepyruvate ferredoxin oxidoreductase subunit alpha [Deltaproteobacteria bacterium RBG_16_49_23]